MPIKTKMKYNYIHNRMIIIKKIADTKFCEDTEKPGSLIQCWWAYKTTQTLWKMVQQFQQSQAHTYYIIKQFATRYAPKRNEDRCPWKALYEKFHSSITFDKLKIRNNPNAHQLVNRDNLNISF